MKYYCYYLQNLMSSNSLRLCPLTKYQDYDASDTMQCVMLHPGYAAIQNYIIQLNPKPMVYFLI